MIGAYHIIKRVVGQRTEVVQVRDIELCGIGTGGGDTNVEWAIEMLAFCNIG